MESLGVRLTAIGDRLRVQAPKGKLPTDLRAQIAERKAEILTYLGQRSSAKGFIPPPIHPRANGAAAPLSFAQERLWFLEQLDPQSAAYNICRAVRLYGKLNVSALEASLNEIIKRHEALRTSFRLVAGQAVQVIKPSKKLAIDTIDLRSLSEGDRDAEIKHLIKAEASHPFDLHGGSLLRCKLLRLQNTERILILLTHHAASDAWSMGILTRELWTLYQAFSHSQSSPLDPLPVQYSDYAVWQREWLQGDLLESQLAHWRECLKDLAVLNLPSDRPRKPRQSFHGARVTIELPDELTRAVNEMSHGHGVTPFMTLLAAFEVLLYRYSGQEDFGLGSPIANRRRPETEGLIGFFVNTLVLRADLSGNPSFSEFLMRVRDVCIGADANQDLPFEKLVQELQPERDQSRNPLFQVMFVLQNATQPFGGIPGLRIEPVEIETTRSPFDLSLFLRERDGRYIGFFEYSTDLFNRDRIERMVGHFQTLLEAAVANPDQPVTTLPILTEAELRQILVEWNNTAADYPKDKCIHQLFEEQMERTPDAIAVEFENQQITYQELNRRANQLAHYLIRLGIGPENLVGICIERSIDMVVGLLGILKAGGAYVPLDPNYPEERLRFMLDDADIAVLLTQESLLDCTQSSTLSPQPLALCLDRDWPVIEQHDGNNPEQTVKSDNLAYVIYTSGSTGQPKGVQIQHRSVVNCFSSIWRKIKITSQDAWLAATTLSFDIAALELFLSLISGAKLIVANRDESIDPTLVRNRLKASGATLMQATPSMWNLLLGRNWERPGKSTILCGGDTLSRQLADRLSACADSVWNLYGPTETTIWSTMARVTANKSTVSIGRPIGNTQIYILDAHLQPTPIGIPGDLYIGGDGLARGYLNRPELTAENFIRNPFSPDPHSRLYRTGDRAEYRANGNIEFLCRSDNQVKIRGHRIELSEIESILNQHPSVKEAVVVARSRDSLEGQDLACYVVGSHEQTPTVGDLRRFLHEKLPPFMIPSLFVFLDAFPLTPNGKIDRHALPPPERERPPFEGFVEPRTEIEELVAQVWREVLKRDKIGVHDNFFDLGGHSLLALQIIIQLREAFDRQIPVGALFHTPTIEDLSRQVERLPRQRQVHALPPIKSIRRDKPLPLSLSQEHLWRLDKMFPGNHFFNMPYVYRIHGHIDVIALKRSLQDIIKRHEPLRTVFAEIDGYPQQIVNSAPDFQIAIMDLRSLDADGISDTAAGFILKERQEPFDLVAGPPIRLKLLRLTAEAYLLLVTIHHIISDEWSMRVFQRELAILYNAYSRQLSSPLPIPPKQHADFAYWERTLIDLGRFDDELNFWKTQLTTSMLESTNMPFHQRRTRMSFRTRCIPIDFDGDFYSTIKTVAKLETVTPFVLLLSALNVLLYCWTDQRNIRIGTLVANRANKDTAGLIGHFVNTVVLCNQVEPTMTVRELLKHAKHGLSSALANQDLPFEHLIYVLQRDLRVDRGALFQVMLIYNASVLETFEPPSELAIRPLEWHYPRLNDNLLTACNLVINVRETKTKIGGTLNYKTDTFRRTVAHSFVTEFTRILKRILHDRDDTIMFLRSAITPRRRK